MWFDLAVSVLAQVVENDPEYWEGISQALAVGWLDIVVKCYVTIK